MVNKKFGLFVAGQLGSADLVWGLRGARSCLEIDFRRGDRRLSMLLVNADGPLDVPTLQDVLLNAYVGPIAVVH